MILDLFGEQYPLTHASRFQKRAERILSHRPYNQNEVLGLAEMLEFYSKEQYGFPMVNFKRMTPLLIDAVLLIRKNGRLIGKMRGATQWDWRWENTQCVAPTPHGLILKCLMKRYLLFVKPFASGVPCERVFTDSWDDSHERT